MKKNFLKGLLATTCLFAMTSVAMADIPNPELTTQGHIYDYQSN